jgi:glycosyltransferase involved in cell wall biosynthesis
MSDRIWISWETQRRNRSLSNRVNAQLFEIDLNLPAWRRYPLAIRQTIALLNREKPRIIFAQNPSMVLACLAIIYANLLDRKVVIDAHNAGLFPAEGRYRLLNWLASKLFRWTTITIVSNSELVSHVRRLNGNAIAIPDPIPEIPEPAQPSPLRGDFNVLFICSWADDEPYLEVLRAAALVRRGTCIYITGNSKGKEQQLNAPVPDNAVFTGFIQEQEFNSMLFSCDAVIVLTTRENCLLCGAYEGVAAGKPLILSNTRALRNHFCKGSVFTDNTADSIAEAIESARMRQAELTAEVKALREKRLDEYPHLLEEFEQRLSSS